MSTARRVGVVLPVLLLVSTAGAQTVSAFAGSVTQQLMSAISQTSPAQIGNILKTGGSIRTGLTGLGGRIGYGGAAQIGAMAIVGALNYYYNTIKDQATGTTLDTYYVPVDSFELGVAYKNPSNNFFGWSAFNAGPTEFTSMAQAMAALLASGAIAEREQQLQACCNYFPNGVQRYEFHPLYDNPSYAQTQMTYYAYPNPIDTLPDFVIANQDAGNGVKVAMVKYLRDQLAANPDALPDGVTVSPAPNANQIAGEAVNPTLDTDRDGYSDAAELAAGTNPNSALSHPDTPPDGPVTPAPVDPNPSTPGGCGDFSFARLMAEPGGWMHDLIFPCQNLSDFMQPLIESAKTKFPFSLTNNLSNLVNYSGGTDAGEVLPSHLGPFTLDWAWIAPLITTVGLLFKAFTTYLMIDFILSKLSGQVVLK